MTGLIPLLTTYPVEHPISEKKIIAIPGIHYFDAHRLDALLLNAPELQLHPWAGNFPEPEGAGDAVDDPSSDEELSRLMEKTRVISHLRILVRLQAKLTIFLAPFPRKLSHD